MLDIVQFSRLKSLITTFHGNNITAVSRIKEWGNSLYPLVPGKGKK